MDVVEVPDDDGERCQQGLVGMGLPADVEDELAELVDGQILEPQDVARGDHDYHAPVDRPVVELLDVAESPEERPVLLHAQEVQDLVEGVFRVPRLGDEEAESLAPLFESHAVEEVVEPDEGERDGADAVQDARHAGTSHDVDEEPGHGGLVELDGKPREDEQDAGREQDHVLEADMEAQALHAVRLLLGPGLLDDRTLLALRLFFEEAARGAAHVEGHLGRERRDQRGQGG